MSTTGIPTHTFQRRRSASLVTSLTLSTWLISLLIVTVIAALGLYWNTRRAEAQVRATASGMAVAVATRVSDEWTQSASSLEASLHHLTEQPFVAFVRIRQPNGGILASAGDPGVPGSQVWVESAPIVYFSDRLGTVEVGILRTAAQEPLRTWATMTLIAALAGSVASAGGAYMVARATARPIREVERLALYWERVDLEETPNPGGPAEIQQLYDSVQEMRGRALERNADLEAKVQARTRELALAYATLDKSFQQTAAALARALEFRDWGTADHTSRTAVLATLIGSRMNLPQERQRRLALAATLHDIGKIGVPEAVLTKAGPLTHDEREIMKKHPVIAEMILRQVEGMAEVARIVRHHHERWDGGGYPDGLSGSEIPLESRIIALADTVEAMSSDRYYRKAMPPEIVSAEVQRCCGSQFDPEVVAAGCRDVSDMMAEWQSQKVAVASS